MARLRFLPILALCIAASVGALSAGAQSALNSSAAAAPPGEIGEVHRLYYAGQAAAALEKADAYLATRPADAQMRFLKGVMLADLQRRAEAIPIFQKLIDDYPDLAEPYNNLAALFAASGDYGRARTTLEQAVRANPGYALAHENLGDVYAALAGQAYARARQLEPQNADLESKLALVRELFKRVPDAPEAAASAASSPKR